MTYYLHNNKLFNIDRMPPDDDFHEETCDCDGCGDLLKEWRSFYIYLSTLQPIPHAFTGENRVVPGDQIAWRYEVLDGSANKEYWIQASEKIYQEYGDSVRRKVAVLKEDVKAEERYQQLKHRAITDPNSLTKEERDFILNHKTPSSVIAKRISEMYQHPAPQQQPAKETMLEQLADLLRKHDVRKYVNVNDSGYSQVERDIVDLFTSQHPQQQAGREAKPLPEEINLTIDRFLHDYPTALLTGTCALTLYGFGLGREISDVDFVLATAPEVIPEDWKPLQLPETFQAKCYYTMEYGKRVEVIIWNEFQGVDIDGIMVTDIYDIIDAKRDLGETGTKKHLFDFHHMLTQLLLQTPLPLPPAPSSVSNPVGWNDLFTRYELFKRDMSDKRTLEEFAATLPYALFISQHGEQETQEEIWEKAYQSIRKYLNFTSAMGIRILSENYHITPKNKQQ